MTEASFRGWRRPGPEPPGGDAPGEGETLDFLSGRWRIFQYARGHRFSTDDLLVAWYGVLCVPRAERVADLGSGIGSVALLVAWKLPAARIVTLEAQEASLGLARRSARFNGVDHRLRQLHGDLRDEAALAGEEPVDLVLGSPPYYPPGTVTPPSHPQAVPARLTLRGNVLEYARAASRLLAPGGLFACVHLAARRAESLGELSSAGLLPVRTRDVVFREGEEARLTLFAAHLSADVPATADLPAVEPPLVVRRADGRHTPEYAAIRLSMGFPPGDLAAAMIRPGGPGDGAADAAAEG